LLDEYALEEEEEEDLKPPESHWKKPLPLPLFSLSESLLASWTISGRIDAGRGGDVQGNLSQIILQYNYYSYTHFFM
jgi:hypothetical protein